MLRPQTAFALSCVVLAAAAVTAPAAIPAGDDLRDHLVRTYAHPDRIAGALADAADASPATTRTGGGRVAPGFEPAVARDLNPDPDVVEVVLVACPARRSRERSATP